jgi:tetratricopeptide (TPR) repeat protein/DNA-binding CsgD family transcriptional regulator
LKKIITVCVLTILMPLLLQAQNYDGLLKGSYAEKVEQIHELYNQLLAEKDSAAVARKVTAFRQFAQKHRNTELDLEMDLFTAYYHACILKIPAEQAVPGLKAVIERAAEAQVWHVEIRGLRVLADYYWEELQNYELAFEQYLLQDRALSTLSAADYPDMARDLQKIGQAYYFFNDYEKAKIYLKRAIALPETEFTTMFINGARNTLGLCYQKEKQFKESDFYFKEITNTKFKKPRESWRYIAQGNIGANYYLKGSYDEALPLLQYDYEQASKDERDMGAAAGAAITLADIYIRRGDVQRCGFYIERAAYYIKQSGQRERLQSFYPVLSKWHGFAGREALAQEYLDSAIAAIREHQQNFSALKLLRVQQKIARQEEELHLADLRFEEQRKTSQRNLLILAVSALITTMVLGYFIHKKRQQAKELELQSANRELELARLNLHKFTDSIAEKNELIEQLQQSQSTEDRQELIAQLQERYILTEEDWTNFQRLFDKLHPGFIQKARTTYSDLTLGELRYFVLSRLQISYREMAAMLGVSPNTIQVMRHRIRKKLDLPNNEALEELIHRL